MSQFWRYIVTLRLRIEVVSLVVILICCRAFAQEPFDLQKGLTPYGSYNGGNLDSVNMLNGNVTLHIPLISFPQRGRTLDLNYSIYDNDKKFIFNYVMSGPNVGGNWSLYSMGCCLFDGTAGAYITSNQGTTSGTLETQNIGNCQNPAMSPCHNTIYNQWIMGRDESIHYLGNFAYSNPQVSPNCSNTSLDFTGYVGHASGPNGHCWDSVLDRDGGGPNFDTNGNFIARNTNGTVVTLTDTLARSMLGSTPWVAVSGTPCSSGTAYAAAWNFPGVTQPYYACY